MYLLEIRPYRVSIKTQSNMWDRRHIFYFLTFSVLWYKNPLSGFTMLSLVLYVTEFIVKRKRKTMEVLNLSGPDGTSDMVWPIHRRFQGDLWVFLFSPTTLVLFKIVFIKIPLRYSKYWQTGLISVYPYGTQVLIGVTIGWHGNPSV